MALTQGDLIAGRYAIDFVVGSGGMGTVYRARDQLSGEFVALKLLNASGVEGEGSERFAREAQVLSELQHPGIVSYVAHGLTPQGLRFLAMDWLEGEDLARHLLRGPLSLSDALLLTERVAEALAFAHRRGVLHRDLKPTNLFLPQGDYSLVKILDFGIARKLSASRAMTRTGAIVGTPEYMAPEQARGVRELTKSVDIFSLGCVLYECLVGEPPFIAEHISAVLVRILFEEPVPAVQRRPGLPEAVSELLGQMLAKDPTRRPSDASAVAELLASIRTSRDLPLLPTLAAPVKPPLRNDSEKMLLSMVLAISPQDVAAENPTLPSSAVPIEKRHGSLLEELRASGAQADQLFGGALVITVQQMASAQDQATQAARCASLIKDRLPDAQVVVVTGRGSRSHGGPTGEALDRAWRLFNADDTPSHSPRPSSSQIRLDHVSARLLEQRFELAPIPQVEGGFTLGSERVDADATRCLLGKPTPCLGRDRELTMLEAVYSECKDELVARAVLVLGAPGLGKSRLRHEFVRRLESRGAQGIVLIGRGDPMKIRSTYGLLGEALSERLGLREGQDPVVQREQIRMRVSSLLPPSEVLRVTVFVGEICGVSFPDEASPQLRAARQDPRIMSDQVERAWLDGLQLLRTDEPLLLILEDLHWGDAVTVRLIGAALRRMRNHALMVLATARPEVHEQYPDLWSGFVQNVPLFPLPRKASERLVRAVLGIDVPSSAIAHIVEQSAGNPLFLEELIRSTAERETGAIPATVIAMIQARLGRLTVVTRRVLRAASVFGEVFWERGLQDLLKATHDDDRAQVSLDSLVHDEIVENVPDGRFANERQYKFRHALVREAAYGLVGEGEMCAWHSAAGKFLEDAGERNASTLAEHFRLGSDLVSAVRCYTKAAEQAYDAGDMERGLECVARGLSCGASGECRGVLLSLQCLIRSYREEYDQILTIGAETVSLLRPGSKPMCQVLYPLMFAALFTRPVRLPELMTSLLRVEPDPEALPCYVFALGALATTFFVAGHRGAAILLEKHVQRVCPGMGGDEYNVWAMCHLMSGLRHYLDIHRPYASLLSFKECVRAANEVGNYQISIVATGEVDRALAHLGQRNASSISMLRQNLLLAERVNDALPLSYARVFLAGWLAENPGHEEWPEAEKYAKLALQAKTPTVLAKAHRALALIALSRGQLDGAEAEVQKCCELYAKFLPFLPDAAALRARIFRAQGKAMEAFRSCEDVLREVNALGILPYAIVDLYVELAESSRLLGMQNEARDAISQAVTLLTVRSGEIPDRVMRASYLHVVPENARLLELARQCGVDITSLEMGA